MRMRYYQRVGKRGGVSMPIWMLPLVGLVWLFTGVVMALAWLLFQILRLVGVGSSAAVRSTSESRATRAAQARDPALIAERAATQRRHAQAQAEARRLIPNILPSHWAWRAVLGAWAMLWIVLGLHDALGALSKNDRSVAGPILGPLVVIGATIALPLVSATGIRRQRLAARLERSEQNPAAEVCGECGHVIAPPAHFCVACGSAMQSDVASAGKGIEWTSP